MSRSPKITVDFVRSYCASIGYTCLSTEYSGPHSKLKLTCINKHNCEISFANLYYGNRRCIHCSKRDNKSIEEVIDFCSKNGWKCLETEYFNCISKMLFEYQGNQHYVLIPKFKMTAENLLEYRERDAFKKQKCIEEGINLIYIPPIPYDKNYYNPQQIKDIVFQILTENGIKFENQNLSTQDIIKAGNT